MPNILTLSDTGDIHFNNVVYPIPTLLTYTNTVIKDHSGTVIVDLKNVLDTIQKPVMDFPNDNTPNYTGIVHSQVLLNGDNLNYVAHDYSDWEIASDINFTC